MPSRKLADMGRGSDLLIHEATMEDGMEDEARIKTHSTTSQAIEVGRWMEAKFILLTHFSQRYSRIPVMTSAAFETNRSIVGVAFDHMTVRPDQLHRLPAFAPVLQLVFADHGEVMAARSEKRKIKAALEQKEKSQQQAAGNNKKVSPKRQT